LSVAVVLIAVLFHPFFPAACGVPEEHDLTLQLLNQNLPGILKEFLEEIRRMPTDDGDRDPGG